MNNDHDGARTRFGGTDPVHRAQHRRRCWRRAMVSGSAVLLLTGCVAPAGDEPAATSVPEEGGTSSGPPLADLFAGRVEIVDMTHALSPNSVAWGTDNPFEYEALNTQPSGAVSMGAYSTPEHHGTHLDAPIHGGDNLPTVDELTPVEMFGPVAVIDVAGRAAEDPDYAVSVRDLEDWEGRHGRLPEGAIVLMNSGWSAKYSDPAAYRNAGDDGRMHFPGFSEAAARFLIDERNIRGIGADTLSVDPGAARGFPVHGVVNGAGKFHLENVAAVDRVPEAGAYLIVAPIKIAGGSGGQVRIFAVIP